MVVPWSAIELFWIVCRVFRFVGTYLKVQNPVALTLLVWRLVTRGELPDVGGTGEALERITLGGRMVPLGDNGQNSGH